MTGRGRPFQKGQSGNPLGRPRGCRNKYNRSLAVALSDDYSKHGAEVIERLRKKSPITYLKFVLRVAQLEISMAQDKDRYVDLGRVIGGADEGIEDTDWVAESRSRTSSIAPKRTR